MIIQQQFKEDSIKFNPFLQWFKIETDSCICLHFKFAILQVLENWKISTGVWWELYRRAVTRKLTCSTGQAQCRISVQVALSVFPFIPMFCWFQTRTDCKQCRYQACLKVKAYFTWRESTKNLTGGDATLFGGRWPASTPGGGESWDEQRVLLEELEEPPAANFNWTKSQSCWK